MKYYIPEKKQAETFELCTTKYVTLVISSGVFTLLDTKFEKRLVKIGLKKLVKPC